MCLPHLHPFPFWLSENIFIVAVQTILGIVAYQKLHSRVSPRVQDQSSPANPISHYQKFSSFTRPLHSWGVGPPSHLHSSPTTGETPFNLLCCCFPSARILCASQPALPPPPPLPHHHPNSYMVNAPVTMHNASYYAELIG